MIHILRSVKRGAVELQYRGLDLFGALEARSGATCNKNVTVLTYHRVLDDSECRDTYSAPGIIVLRETFERQMQLLARHFCPIDLDQFIVIANGSVPCPKRAVLVTFDDGWADTYTTAYPALRAAGVPAAVFVVSGLIGTREIFWQEEMSRHLDCLSRSDDARARQVLSRMELSSLPGLSRDERRMLIRRRIDRLKKTGSEHTREALEELRRLSPGSERYSEIDRLMTWEQAKELAFAGVSIGSHTVSHRILTQLNEGELVEELGSSKAVIEERIGLPVRAVAYPNGDFNAQVRNVTRGAGYEVAFTTVPGTYSPGSNSHSVSRRNLHQNTAAGPYAFRAYVAGLR